MHHQPVFGRRRVLAVAAGLTALVAAGGATGLVGGFIDIGDRLQSRLPFASPVFGGVALALIVALPFAILAGRAWSGRPGTGAAAVFAGALLVGWIVVEVAFLRELSFLHPLCVVVGGAFVVVGLTRRGAIEHPVDADAQPRLRGGADQLAIGGDRRHQVPCPSGGCGGRDRCSHDHGHRRSRGRRSARVCCPGNPPRVVVPGCWQPRCRLDRQRRCVSAARARRGGRCVPADVPAARGVGAQSAPRRAPVQSRVRPGRI